MIRTRIIGLFDRLLNWLESVNQKHGGDLGATATHEATMGAKVIRADGSVEDLGIVSRAKLTNRGARELNGGSHE